MRPGALIASVECFNCTILGQGGHGAMPHQTIDSIVVAAQEDMSFFLQEVPGCYSNRQGG